MSKAEGKSRKPLFIALIAAAVVLAIALALVLTMCGGKKDDNSGNTEPVAGSDEYTLFWNVDRKLYAGMDATGMSSREPNPDTGYYQVLFAMEGRQGQRRVAERRVINKIDNMDLMGLVLDENGIVVDVKSVEEITGGYAVNKFYVESVDGNTIVTNSSNSLKGMQVELTITDKTKIYDVSGETGMVGCETTLAELDCILAIQNKAGEITHIYAVEREPQGPTQTKYCDHCKTEVVWRAWAYDNTLPTNKSGHYYLYTDVKLTTQQSISANMEIVLDLNGKTVTGSGSGRMYSLHNEGVWLSIMDYSAEKTGKMVATGNFGAQGGVVWVRYGKFDMYGGTLDASQVTNTLNGVTVCIDSKSECNLYGGTWIGGTAQATFNAAAGTTNAGRGGTVMNFGVFNMYDGVIKNGKAKSVFNTKTNAYSGGTGGNVDNHGGSAVFTMSGGTIENGTADGYAGNIYLTSGATVNISGGTISGGQTLRAGQNGGNIASLGCKLNISGGTIKNGTTRNCGGNIYTSGVFNLSGGTITGGKKLDATTGKEVDSYSKNLFVVNGTTTITGGKIAGYAELVPTTQTGCIVNISGNPVIYGAPEGSVNLRIPSGTLLNVGKMSSGAKIGVTAAGIISNKTAETNKKYFLLDGTGENVNYYGGCLCIGEVLEKCICGHAHTEEDPGVGDCTGELLAWMEMSGSVLPSKGNYYLTSDVYISGQSNVINAEMNLSLNGFNVYRKTDSYGRTLQLRTGAKVALTNWGKTEGGKMINTYGYKADADGGDSGCLILVHNYSPDQTYYDYPELDVYDVTLAARDGENVAQNITIGSVLCLYSGTVDLFEGAELIGGKSWDNGGNVYVGGSKAILNIKGATIRDGEAIVTKRLVDYTAETPEISLNGSGAVIYRGGQGGNIQIQDGATVNIYEGSVISGGKANVAGNIGLGTKSTLNMYGGTITGGQVGNDIRNNGAHGGNMAVFGTLNMEGGRIEKGIAGNGGNISIHSGTINMTGGTISGGRSERVIKINDDGTPMIVGGEQQLSGGTGGNIYMFHVGAAAMNLNGGFIEDGWSAWDGANLFLSSAGATTKREYKIGAVTIRNGKGNKGANVYISGTINKTNGVPNIEGNHTYTFEGTIIEGGDTGMYGAGMYLTGGAKVFINEGTKIQNNFIRSGVIGNGANVYLVGGEGNELTMNGGMISGGLGTDSGANVYLGGGAVLTMNDGLIINGGIRTQNWTETSTISYTNGNGSIHNVNGVLKLNGGYIDGYVHNNTTGNPACKVYVSGNPYVGDVSDEVCAEYGVEDMTSGVCGMSFGTWGTGVPADYVATRHQFILTGEMTEGAKITVNNIGAEQGYPFLTGAANENQSAYDVTGYTSYFVTTTGAESNCQMVGTGSDAYGELYFGLSKCLCGHAHTEEDPGQGDCDGTKLFWSPWNSSNSLPDSGNYYLTTDVTINNKAWRNKTVNIAMNGFNIKSTSNRPLQLQASAKVTITNWTNTTGKITGSKVDGDGGLALLHLYYPADDTSITGATLKAPELTLYSVHMDATGVINTKGGANDIACGGAIYAIGGDKAANAVPGLTEATHYISKVNLYGDTIIENGRAKKGGNIYVTGTAELIMDDNAIIRNGTAIDEGGNVRFDYKLTMSGSSSIYGGFDENQPNADHKNVAMVMVNGKTYGTHLNMSENASIAGFISAWYGDAGNLRSYTLSGNVQIVGTKPEGAADDFVVHGFNWPAADDLNVSGLTKDAKIMVSGNAAGYFATGVSDANKDWIAGCFEPIPSVDADIYVDGNKLFMGKQYCLCGSTTDEHVAGFCDGIKHLWQPAVNMNAIKNVDGKTDRAYYLYLTSDIDWESYQLTLDNGEQVYIDLNGYKITNGGGSRMMRTLGSNGSTLVITNTSDKASSIINTSQTIDQGGIIWGAGNNTNNVKVYNVTLDVSGGKARIFGTAIVSGNANVDLYNVIIKGGVAKAAVANDVMNQPLGGAVSVRGGKLTWNGGELIGGEVIGGYDSAKGAPSYISGGAFFINAGSAELTNVDISGGKASYFTYNNGSADKRIDGWGGNIGIEGGTFKMTGGSVKNGFAHAGGNIYNWGGTAEFNGVIIEGGEAGWSGGNMILDTNSTSTFENCTITGGTCTNEGGSIRTRSATKVEFKNCTISGGTSTEGNGGTINSGSFVTFDGCTITGGDAGNVAGCWQINGGANIKNCTISGGTIKGGTGASTACLFMVGGNTTIENTTISGNCEIYGSNTGTVTFKGKVTMDDLYVGPIGTKLLVVDSTFDGANSSIMLRNAGNFAGRAFASATAASQAAGFKTPAAVTAGVSYVDGKLYVADTKVMCLCGETHDADYTNCDGTKLTWLSWESKTSLPTSGNWYLTDNVTLSSQYTLRSNTLNLSLNGYSIQTDGKQRVFQLRPSSKLTLTNWGKNIGGVIRNAYGFPDGYDGPTGAIALIFDYGIATGDVPSIMNVMDVTLDASGAAGVTHSGALQISYGTVNLYKGAKVIGTTARDYAGTIGLFNSNATLNVFAGASVSGGTATNSTSENILVSNYAKFNNAVEITGVDGVIKHCNCGITAGHAANDKCDGVVHEWQAYVTNNGLPTGDGYWYLYNYGQTINVNGQKQIAANAHTHLNLNGMIVNGNPNGRTYVTFNDGSALTLTDTHTGTAAGKIIATGTSTNGQTGMIWVRNGDLTVYNVTLDASGFSVNRGSVLNVESGRKVSIYNANIIGGSASTRGGAIWMNKNCSLTIVDSNVTGGNATEHGGSIYGEDNNTFVFTNSTFVGGTSQYGDVFRTANGNVTITGCSMAANTSKQSSVAWVQHSKAGYTTTIKDTTILGGILFTTVADGNWADVASPLQTINITGKTNIGTATNGGLFMSNKYQTVNFTGLTGTVYVGGDANAKLVADAPKALMSNLKSASADYFLSWEVEAGTDTVGDIYYRPNTLMVNCICGHEHTEEDPGVGDCTGASLIWEAWTSTTTLPKDATKNYYLTGNVTVNNTNWTVATNIAMNGKNIYGSTNRPIQMRKGGKLTLTNWKNTTGGIISSPYADNNGGLVMALNMGDSTAAPEFYAYNVKFDASQTKLTQGAIDLGRVYAGGAIMMTIAGNKLGLYDCEITGSPNCNGSGGAIAFNGTGSYFEMEGCTVTGGTTTAHGGNIYIGAGETHIDNCTISGGRVTSDKDNGASTGGNLRLAGTTYISNTTISGGYSASNSGNIQFGGNATLTNVIIKDGHALNVAGNAQVTGTVTMTGCEVYGGMCGAGKDTNAQSANLQVVSTSFTIDGSTIKGRMDVYSSTNAIVLKNKVVIADDANTNAGICFNATNYKTKGFVLDASFDTDSKIAIRNNMPDGAILVANVAAANADAVVDVFDGDSHTATWVASATDATVGNVVANVKS